MSKKTPLPPELGGRESKEEFEASAGRAVRADFVRLINGALEATPTAVSKNGERRPDIFPKAEQAQVLRQMADQLEKAEQRNGVLERSQARLHERHSPTAFFTRIGSPSDYWHGKGKEPVARQSPPPAKDWTFTPAPTAPRVVKDWNAKPEPSREIKPLPERGKDRDWER